MTATNPYFASPSRGINHLAACLMAAPGTPNEIGKPVKVTEPDVKVTKFNDALAALAPHSQVLLAVPNPCRFHWADIMDGREMLRMARRRFALKGGQDLSLLPLEAMHAHAHPLLASWGRQGRDFVRMLDEFDQGEGSRYENLRVDLFDESEGEFLRRRGKATPKLRPHHG